MGREGGLIGRPAARELALSLLCGAALALAFPRAAIGPLAWIAPVPWLIQLLGARQRRGALLGLAFGLGFFGLLLNWVHGVLAHYTSLPLFLTVPIWLLLVGYLALYPALFGWAVAGAAKWSAGAALALAPVLWVGAEFARGRLLGGFPWGTAGYARAGGLPLLQAASVGGVALVSLLLASAWSALAVLVLAARSRWRGRAGRGGDRGRVPFAPGLAAAGAAGAALAGIAFAVGLGASRLTANPPVADAELFGPLAPSGGWLPLAAGGAADTRTGAAQAPLGAAPGMFRPPGPGAPTVIALVQGGFGSDFEYEEAPRILRSYMDLSRRAAQATPPALIVWPESSAPYQPDRDEAYLKTLEGLSRETGALLLLGAVGGAWESGFTNSAWLVGPEGVRHRYDKRRLVQYGEYVPLKRLFPFVRKFVPQAGDFLPGALPGVVEAGPRSLGIAICYEVIFPEELLEQVRLGASLLVNITNDSWFSGGGPWQHADFAPVRAIETGRWLARVASTGRTLLVDPLGRLRAAGPLGGQAVLVAAIPRAAGGTPSGRTPYVRRGDWAGKGCATLALLALAFLLVGNNIDRRRQSGRPQAAEG